MAVLPMMTASELVDELAEETGWSKGDVRQFLDSLTTVITNVVSDGYRVKLPVGIQIEPRVRPATKRRKGRNPRTGEEVIIKAKPASATLKAKIVKPLRDTKLPSVRKLNDMM